MRSIKNSSSRLVRMRIDLTLKAENSVSLLLKCVLIDQSPNVTSFPKSSKNKKYLPFLYLPFI